MIWLIGGTSESRAIATALRLARVPWVVTVTRPTATRLYAGLQDADHQVVVTRLGTAAWPEFCQLEVFQRWSLRGVVDASHPFATDVSQLAIALSQQAQLPYLRFERPDLPLTAPCQAFPDWASVLQPAQIGGKRLFFTTGLQSLRALVPWQTEATIWARVLPTSRAAAIATGFAPEQLIYGFPPTDLKADFAAELDLWSRLRPQAVVTKASGVAGGVALKQAVAAALDIPLWVLTRPPLPYPHCTSDPAEAVAIAQSWLA